MCGGIKRTKLKHDTMIRKDVKVGNVNVGTIIELGNGDVQVAAVKQPDEKYTGIEFMNDVPNPIGTSHNTAGTTTDNSRPEAMITFTDIASIEVVERALNKAKVMLRNM